MHQLWRCRMAPRKLADARPQRPLGARISRLHGKKWEAKERNLLRFGPPFLNPYDGYVSIISHPDWAQGEVFTRAGIRSGLASHEECESSA